MNLYGIIQLETVIITGKGIGIGIGIIIIGKGIKVLLKVSDSLAMDRRCFGIAMIT